MGFFSLKETCSCCGEETGFNKYKCKGGYLCPKCLKLLQVSKKMAIPFRLTGAEVKEIIGVNNVCTECGVSLENGFKKFKDILFCRSCYINQKGEAKEKVSLSRKEIREQKLKDYSRLQEKAKLFKIKCTNNVEKYIYFDDNLEELCIPGFLSEPKFIKYSEILDFELLEDGSTISSGGVGRAVAGGLILGGAGAIVGGITGKKKTKNIATSMQIKITTKDMNDPVVYIKIFKGDYKKTSVTYNIFQKNARNIISMLQIAVDKISQNAVSNTPIVQENSKSKVDELKELKGLLDDGILTREEFEAEKAKVLNR